jgi:serine phosphatase RsbU (regulator of sigma subunit)/pSer/pThr/pTyr-binding forkhead associated (FHA) protein
MPTLRIMSGPQSGASVPVTDAVVIGRSRSAGLHFDDRTLSRLHARLEPAEGEWRLTDLGSSNGSFVNGRPLKTAAGLRDGDVVRLGSFSFAFRADPPGVSALNITLDTGAEKAPIIENVSVDDHIQQLLPKGIEKDAGELVIKRLRFLSEVADILGNVIEAAQLFPRVLEKLLEVYPEAERGCVMACDPDGGNLRPLAALARPGAQSRMAVSRSLAREVVGTRSAVLSADVSGDRRFDPQHTVVRSGLRTVMCAPMVCEDTVLGLIQLDSSNPDHQFSRADMALFLGVAGQAALAFGKARLHDQLVAQVLLQKDLQMAERIQHSFLPKSSPQVSGYRFAQSYSAARHIGGDYYDFVRVSDSALAIAVADVSGKGVAAALYMAKLSSEMRFHARGCLSAAEVVTALNRALAEEMESGMFVTLALLILQPEIRNLIVCSAGHLPPLLCSREGEISELAAPGNIPIGVFEDSRYTETEHLLQPGDRVLLYTDGVTEAMDREGGMFGTERLRQVVRDLCRESPEAVLAAVSRAVAGHAAGVPQSDDLAMVCLAVDD